MPRLDALPHGGCTRVHVCLGFQLLWRGGLGAELRDLQLTFADDRKVVQLPVLSDSFATHVYISRLWINAQEHTPPYTARLSPYLAAVGQRAGAYPSLYRPHVYIPRC